MVLLWQGQDGGCFEETILERLNCIGCLLSQIVGPVLETGQGFLLRTSFENSVEESLYLVVTIGGSLVEYVALEVSLSNRTEPQALLAGDIEVEATGRTLMLFGSPLLHFPPPSALGCRRRFNSRLVPKI